MYEAYCTFRVKPNFISLNAFFFVKVLERLHKFHCHHIPDFGFHYVYQPTRYVKNYSCNQILLVHVTLLAFKACIHEQELLNP
jgi:hypothetical protein